MIVEGSNIKEVTWCSEHNVTSFNIPQFVEPPFFTQVGLFITFHCPIRCRHCMVNAGPDRTEEVSLDDVLDWLYQIASFGNGHVKTVALTGGEPFSRLKKLLKISAVCRDLELDFTVMTSGFWASSEGRTRSVLRSLCPNDISVSTDVYHLEHVPIDRVERLYSICHELGIRCDISLTYDIKTLEETRRLIKHITQFATQSAIRVSRIFPSGRGEHLRDHFGDVVCLQGASDIPCLFATVPYILPNGDVLACAGPIFNVPRENNPLYLGSLKNCSFREIFDRSQNNPILHGIRIWGPRFWHQLIERHGPKVLLPDGYYTTCPCEGCITLLKIPEIAKFLYTAVHSERLNSAVQKARRSFLEEADKSTL